MSDKRKREFMEKLESCYKVVQQSSAKGIGISAVEVAEQLGVHRTTAHSYLNTLEFMGKVYSQKGLWFAKPESEGKPPLAVPEHLVKRFWEEEKLIEAAHLEGEYDLAYRAALNLTLKFPSPYKEKLLNETFQPIKQKLKEISAINEPFKQALKKGRFLGSTAIPKIIEDISKTLYEMSGGS
jgi:hypothetical protein